MQRTSRGFNLAHIGFMLMLVSLNFPTAALARYGDGAPWAVALYAVVVAGAGPVLLRAIVVAARQDLFDPVFDDPMRRRALFMVTRPTGVFLTPLVVIVFSRFAAMLCRMLAALRGLARSRGRFGVLAAMAGSALAR